FRFVRVSSIYVDAFNTLQQLHLLSRVCIREMSTNPLDLICPHCDFFKSPSPMLRDFHIQYAHPRQCNTPQQAQAPPQQTLARPSQPQPMIQANQTPNLPKRVLKLQRDTY
ncbi:hypothetical protein PMAYCL1PPCAC_28242, partial [Pristionchus mayeri]